MNQQPTYDLLGIVSAFGPLLATLLSPLIALWATVFYQRRDRSYQLKLSVFVDLMRYRRKNLSQEYVHSLNLVPVVFHDKPRIVTAFKDVMEVYESNDWRVPHDSPSGSEIRQRMNQTLQTKTAVLLSNMAQDVRIDVDQLTILQGAYMPEQWNLEETMEYEIKQSLRSILRNERPFPVFAHIEPSMPQNTGSDNNDTSPATESEHQAGVT